MLFSQDRQRMRLAFAEAWGKQASGVPLEPLERQLADVVAMHPEYHALLADARSLERDFPGAGEAENPFLHLGLHVALHEQLTTGRPAGVRAVYARLCERAGEAHAVEHAMIDCLQRVLSDAQSSGTPPDEKRYLACLRRIERPHTAVLRSRRERIRR